MNSRIQSRYRSPVRLLWQTLSAGWFALLVVNPVWAQNYSQARAVRLSFVEGNVTLLRPDVQGWAEAPVNTPLQEGFELSTGENSFAEVQFENGGTIRLGQFALLDFTKLELAPDGSMIDQVELRQGYATFHPLSSRYGEALQVGTPYGVLAAQSRTLFRVDLVQGVERVEVFSGEVDVQSNLGAMTIESDSVLIMQPGATEPTVVSQGITKDDWDQWVDDRETRMAIPPNGPSADTYTDDASAPPYGWSDLQQYGSWSYVPGEGYGWAPAFITGGWSPYSAGQWCWYHGWGYTWIGAEPWGWLPYHYGGWDLIPGKGWIWFPGSLRTWHASRVTWFHGPNWVGWVPRSHNRDGGLACGNNCGGGAVSISTFRHGGLLTSGVMLGFNPTSGERVSEPGIIPSTSAKLPGRVASLPAAQSQSFQANGATVGASTAITPAASAAPLLPAPVLRGGGGQGAERRGFGAAAGPPSYSFAKQAPSASQSKPSQIGGGGKAASTGAHAVGHFSSAPSGGGHAATAPSGGGGGGHH